MSLSATDWISALTKAGVRVSTAARWHPVFVDQVQPEKFSRGMDDIVEFVPQILHESMLLERLEEDLNYSAARLLQVWPQRFPGGLAEAVRYAYHPMDLAEKVYGGRMGNTRPGDGWKFRGHGLIMLTGQANYRLVEQITGIPITNNPDMLSLPENAMRVAIAWWEKKIPDGILGDVERETEIVNGGEEGLARRVALEQSLKESLA